MNQQNLFIAIVGMCGSGKGAACNYLKSMKHYQFQEVYFGQVTLDEMAERKLQSGANSEKFVREALRTEFGMDVYAVRNEPIIRTALESGHVVIDGMYNWDEREYLKKKFPQLKVLAIYASPATRKERLVHREVRPLTEAEVDARDKAEIENIAKGGPIAMADYTIINEHDINYLHMEIDAFVRSLTFLRKY